MQLTIRPLTAADVDFALALKDRAGWNQLRADWLRLIALDPEGCFLAETDGQPAGTATTIRYGDQVGWIGMLVVVPELRGRGIGTALLTHCIRYLQSHGVEAIMLDATEMGRPLYEKLGFVGEFSIGRMSGPLLRGPAPDVRPMQVSDLEAASAYDRRVFGADRRRLLATYLQGEGSSAGWLVEEDGRVRGYCLLRPGSRRWQIGPLLAEDQATAEQLLFAAMSGSRSPTVYLDVLADKTSWIAFLQARGFRRERGYTRMRLGEGGVRSDVSRMYLIAGAEFG